MKALDDIFRADAGQVLVEVVWVEQFVSSSLLIERGVGDSSSLSEEAQKRLPLAKSSFISKLRFVSQFISAELRHDEVFYVLKVLRLEELDDLRDDFLLSPDKDYARSDEHLTQSHLFELLQLTLQPCAVPFKVDEDSLHVARMGLKLLRIHVRDRHESASIEHSQLRVVSVGHSLRLRSPTQDMCKPVLFVLGRLLPPGGRLLEVHPFLRAASFLQVCRKNWFALITGT